MIIEEAQKFTSALREYSLSPLALSFVGVASLDGLREYINPAIAGACERLDSAIVIGLRVSPAVTSTIRDRPTLIYKHHYTQLNYLLDRSALQIAEWIMAQGELVGSQGFSALPIPASQVVDFGAQKADFSHRHAAVAAGLGWLGRNNLFVHPEFGAHCRLATVLTDMPLTHGTSIFDSPASEHEGCGDCHACIDACPAGALSMDSYNFDRCFAKLIEFRKLPGIGHHICGICVKACNNPPDPPYQGGQFLLIRGLGVLYPPRRATNK